MSETSVPTPAEIISNKPLALAGNEHHNVDTGDPVDYWHWLGQHDAYPEPALEWRGPLAFARAHGALPGIDHEFGIHWGSKRDQRVRLRVEVGAETGLLYVYDPTWDEYAILGTDVPLAAALDAIARWPRLGEHPSVEDFVALLPNVTASRPTPGPEL